MGRRTLVLIIALVLAAVSAFAVFRFLSTVESDIAADFVRIDVYRASQPIATGTEGEIANEFIVESTALSSVLEFDTDNRILCTGVVETSGQTEEEKALCDDQPRILPDVLNGKVAAGPITPGQLITEDMFISAALLNTVFLSEDIPAGKVAYSFRVGEEAAVGGFIRPFDNINIVATASIQLSQIIDLVSDPDLRDLIIDLGLGEPTTATTLPPGGEEQTVDPVTAFAETLPSSIDFTQTILQNVQVIAVGPDTRQAVLGTGLTPQGTQIIVVEVTSEQAEQIEFATEFTSVALTLLPKDELYTPFDAPGVVVDDLFTLLERIEEQLQQVGARLGS